MSVSEFFNVVFDADTGEGGTGAPPAVPAPVADGDGTPADTVLEEPPVETPPDTSPDGQITDEVVIPPLPGTPEHTRRRAQDGDAGHQVSVLQNSVAELSTQLRQAQEALLDYEYAGLDETEADQARLARQAEELAQREEAIQEAQVTQAWWEYYSQWPGAATVLKGSGPVEWQHELLSHYTRSLAEAKREMAALKRAATETPTTPPEPTKTGGQGAAQRNTIFQMPWEDIEALHQRAIRGDLDEADYPPLE